MKARRRSDEVGFFGGLSRVNPVSLSLIKTAGPAIVASMAYVDPGNIATNIQAGAGYGGHLIAVVVFANLAAMLFQILAAKLGIATGHNLAQLSRDEFARPIVYLMWVLGELAAMATDIAELLGGAIGISLLLHVSLFVGMILCAAAAFAILYLQRWGSRSLAVAIGGFIVLIGICYVGQMLIAGTAGNVGAALDLTPQFRGPDAIALAVALIGATIMPHAIYLHSALAQTSAGPGRDEERRKLILFSNREVVLALGAAGIVNIIMVAVAAAAFHDGAHDNVTTIGDADRVLRATLGQGASLLFLVALIGSGLSSSAVGTLAGQVIMQGYLRRRIPLWLRRCVTMAPAFIVIFLTSDATAVLVLSQIVLSLTLPAPLIALIVLTRRKRLMGHFANGPWMQGAAVTGACLVILLNLLLVVTGLGLTLPFAGGR